MLEDIQKNIERLIALYEGEKRERLRLLALCGELRQENDAQVKQITDLKRQVDNLTLKEAFTASSGGSSAKEKIDRLIREIDRSVALLEK